MSRRPSSTQHAPESTNGEGARQRWPNTTPPKLWDAGVRTVSLPEWVISDGLFWRWVRSVQTVYVALCTYARGDMACYGSRENLQRLTNMSRPTLYRALARLERDGAIVLLDRGGGRGGRMYTTFVLAFPGMTRKFADQFSRVSAAPRVSYMRPHGSHPRHSSASDTSITSTLTSNTHQAPVPEIPSPPLEDSVVVELRKRLQAHEINHTTIAEILASRVPPEQIENAIDNGETMAGNYKRRKKDFSVAGYIVSHYTKAEPLIAQARKARAARIAIEEQQRANEQRVAVEKSIDQEFAALAKDGAGLADFQVKLRQWCVKRRLITAGRATLLYENPKPASWLVSDPHAREFMKRRLASAAKSPD